MDGVIRLTKWRREKEEGRGLLVRIPSITKINSKPLLIKKKKKSCVLNWIAYDMTKIYTCIVQDSQKQNIVVQTPFRLSSK